MVTPWLYMTGGRLGGNRPGYALESPKACSLVLLLPGMAGGAVIGTCIGLKGRPGGGNLSP